MARYSHNGARKGQEKEIFRGGAPSKRRRVCAALLRIVKAVEELLSEERPGDAEVH